MGRTLVYFRTMGPGTGNEVVQLPPMKEPARIMTDHITPLPLAESDRRRLDRRNHIVRCEVTGRWLRFHPLAEAYPQGTYLIVDLMEEGQDGDPRRLCELVLSREELLAVIGALPVRNQ